MTDMRGWPIEASTDDEGQGTATAAAFADAELDERGYPTEATMLEALKAVMDPEIGIDVVNLGLVYEAWVEDGGKAQVRMTLTTMGCPLTELIHQQVTLVLTRLPGVEEADVEFVFTPPWSTDMISEEAKEELRAMGFSV